MKNNTIKSIFKSNLIVKSLFSGEPNEDYVNLYLTDDDVRNKCNKLIYKILFDEFSNKIYNIDGCLNFLNNVVSRQLNDKPYLLELNIIINTINDYIEKIKTMSYLSNDKKEKYSLDMENAKLKCMLAIISDEFILKQDINFNAEVKMATYYINMINNDEPLSKEEVEELISFYLTCGFDIYNAKTSSNFNVDVLDYVFKNVLRFDYKIDKFLYKKLFVYEYKKELERRNIKDMTIVFNHDRYLGYEMMFYPLTNTLSINNTVFIKRPPVENIISFFHELRHYEQYNYDEENLKALLCAKDIYLADISKKYYDKNYDDLAHEKEANNDSFQYAYEYIKEKCPHALPRAKNRIYELAVLAMQKESRNIHMRRIEKNKTEDINLLFDRVLRKKKNLLYVVSNGRINKSILFEYNIQGKKRSVFELLSEKENAQKLGLNSKLEIYNYLLYEESVPLKYILDNLRLFESDENKKQYAKYYGEAKQVLKQKLIGYYINKIVKKNNEASINGNNFISEFYDLVIDGLRKVNIRGLRKDKNIELYREKEEEIRVAYKWLYNLISEIEEEHVESVKSGKSR